MSLSQNRPASLNNEPINVLTSGSLLLALQASAPLIQPITNQERKDGIDVPSMTTKVWYSNNTPHFKALNHVAHQIVEANNHLMVSFKFLIFSPNFSRPFIYFWTFFFFLTL